MQMTPAEEAVMREMARLQRNYEFLSYGLIVAWLILVIYVLLMMRREQKLRREIASLRAMLEDKVEGKEGRPSHS